MVPYISYHDMLQIGFLTSFPICIPLSFDCLTALAKTLNTVLNRYGESREPCLVPVTFSPFKAAVIRSCLGRSMGYIICRQLVYDGRGQPCGIRVFTDRARVS